MIKMNLLDYEIHCGGKHVADIDDEQGARGYALVVANQTMKPTVVINKWTGEIVAEYAIKQCVVEVAP